MQAKQQKSTLAKKGEVQHQWHTIDAQGQILGRLASRIAMILMGKHTPAYTYHVDTGDFVVVTNASKIKVTGEKSRTKNYDYYTYHPGGRKVVTYQDLIVRKPEQIITEAVRRMLPKTKMGRHMLSKLKVYRGTEHPHSAQRPQEIKLN
jgi:large subunit ribosomal protein L13